ncbi:UDP-N-acetylmuramate dehydrogenase [Nitrospirota bacterium]
MLKESVRKELMAIAMDMNIRFDEPMREHTSLRIGGPADAFVTPTSADGLSALVKFCSAKGLENLMLGGGTNTLAADAGVKSIVIHSGGMDEIEIIRDVDGKVEMNVGTGLRLQGLLAYCKREGLSGLEGLTGVPGHVGGAIAGNAGSFGSSISDVLIDVVIMDSDGTIRTIKKEELSMGYRSATLPSGAMIMRAGMRFNRLQEGEVARRIQQYLITKKDTQPLDSLSAGCVFKNPQEDSAGRLLDAAGCKGMREGGIEVSSLHAGFFINTDEGNASDFLRLMDRTHVRVHEAFGISLEPEIKVIG